MEQALAAAQMTWTRRSTQDVLQRARPPRREPQPAPDQPGWDAMDHLLDIEQQRQTADADSGRKLPTPPAWWKGDEAAHRANLIAMQQLRRGR